MSQPKRILIVDDSGVNREVLKRTLVSLGYDPEEACDGFEALVKVKMEIDLVLLDAVMPGMDGFQVLRRIREDSEIGHLPVIMVTSLESQEDRVRAIEAGADDFINRPVDEAELLARMTSMVAMKEAQDAIVEERTQLDKLVKKRTSDLRKALTETAEAQRRAYGAQRDTLHRLALAAEARDEHTVAHVCRISVYCGMLARAARLPPHEVELIEHASPLHDVGRVSVPPEILSKPGRLTAEEREVMKQHTLMGARILAGSSSDLLKAAETIALTHHEKWDGTGYPGGLSGDKIPLYGRLCAIADVFDALTNERPYKKAFPSEVAAASMREDRAKHFAPELLDVFLAHLDQIERVREVCRSCRPEATQIGYRCERVLQGTVLNADPA
ncbi:MAG: response regulator [Armatimonadetes bacterium]|nr:response regulator [Armatimonadota bacterium]